MVQAMMRRPPQDSLLRRTLRQEGHRELRRPAQLVTSVPEISVIACRDSKHAERVSQDEPGEERPGRPGPPHARRTRMNQQEKENRPELVLQPWHEGQQSNY
jgi:hypothetical protein